MPDWLNQNEPPSINLRSSSGFQWAQWAGDRESPSSAPLEPQLHEITGCWSPLSVSGYVTAGAQQADVIHTGASSWLGWWGCKAMLCSSRACGGLSSPAALKSTLLQIPEHPKQHPNTNWVTRGNTPKVHSKHFQVVRRSSKAVILGCLYLLDSTLCIKSTSL